MATGARITVSNTPVRLDIAAPADNVRGHKVIIKNTHGADDLVLGGPTVAAGTGFRLAFGQTITVELGDPESLYGIRGGTNDITADVLYVS